ncbi:hypothetical protein BDV96DRAFT_15519 [Lophiotrema nucula]|uniref:Uncharacterized protein n=1 Tax=Lophiotrema nucula TaxID=690887 RepID=A0A6A5ZW69_9PLEO|nr:hypothetical protein BDV96DRAFT_15519 [Lophiotrema nucula]
MTRYFDSDRKEEDAVYALQEFAKKARMIADNLEDAESRIRGGQALGRQLHEQICQLRDEAKIKDKKIADQRAKLSNNCKNIEDKNAELTDKDMDIGSLKGQIATLEARKKAEIDKEVRKTLAKFEGLSLEPTTVNNDHGKALDPETEAKMDKKSRVSAKGVPYVQHSRVLNPRVLGPHL